VRNAAAHRRARAGRHPGAGDGYRPRDVADDLAPPPDLVGERREGSRGTQPSLLSRRQVYIERAVRSL